MLYTKELNLEECRTFLHDSNFGRIACSLNNQPYIVPINFAFDEKEYIYAFSTLGQKILWMRENPLVCLEVENIKNQDDWTSVIISGKYQELTEDPDSKRLKDYAHELLSSRPRWWKPAYLAGATREGVEEIPIYFRVHIESMTGKRIFSGEVEKTSSASKKVKATARGLW